MEGGQNSEGNRITRASEKHWKEETAMMDEEFVTCAQYMEGTCKCQLLQINKSNLELNCIFVRALHVWGLIKLPKNENVFPDREFMGCI